MKEEMKIGGNEEYLHKYSYSTNNKRERGEQKDGERKKR